MAKPPLLRAGDTVGVVAPGSPISRERLEEGIALLQEMGLTVRLGESVGAYYGHLAGNDELRARDFNAMWRDPAINGIIAARGGWGSVRILPLLDWEAIRQTPKVLVGYSDITTLLNAIYKMAGHVTFHGPMVGSFGDIPAAIAYNVQVLRQAVTISLPIGLYQRPAEVPPPITLVSGTARGRVVGGNLSALVGMLGTPWEPSFAERIVFLEEGNEPVYRVDRMLTQLIQTGRLQRAAGIVFGWSPSVAGPMLLTDLLRERLTPLGKPAYYGFWSGHEAFKATLPLGVQAEMDAGAGRLSILEAAVRPR